MKSPKSLNVPLKVVWVIIWAFYPSESSLVAAFTAQDTRGVRPSNRRGRVLEPALTLTCQPHVQKSSRRLSVFATDQDAMDASVTGGDENDDTSPATASFTPRPPSYPPPLYSLNLQQDFDALSEQAATSESNVADYSSKIQDLEERLLEKENALRNGRDSWSVEKTSLVAKIAEFTNMFNSQEDEEETKERMEKEVRLLQGQLTAMQQQLRQEKQAAVEVKKRLEDVNDAMEFQQMEFTKEKKDLQKTVDEEKRKLSTIQSQWNQDKQRFEKEKGSIEEQLKQELNRLQQAEQEWTKNQDDFTIEQKSLQDQLVQQMSKLKWTETELQTERGQFETEKSALQKAIQQEQIKVREVEAALGQEKKRFQEAQTVLEGKIKDEQGKVANLSDRLQREQERFDMEKTNLQARIDLERQRLTAVEEKLAREQVDFTKERSILQDQVEEEVRLRKVKKRQMNERYENIRQELTALWQGAKREAREEKKALTSKYDTEIFTLNGTIAELEVDLFSTRKQGEELQVLLKDVTAQKERATQDAEAMERRFTTMVSVRNAEIGELKTNLQELRTVVEKKEAQLKKYESSFREILKLSLQVTGKKFKSSRSRISGWVQRRGRREDTPQRSNKKLK